MEANYKKSSFNLNVVIVTAEQSKIFPLYKFPRETEKYLPTYLFEETTHLFDERNLFYTSSL
jgi:hypothetical protein